MEDADLAHAGPKKSSPVILIAALAVLTLIAGGGGWLIGGMLAPKPLSTEEAKLVDDAKAAIALKKAGEKPEGEASKKDEGLPKIATEANGVVQLDAITTNLAYPTENWIRLEVALLFKGAPDVAMAEQIHQDIAAYLKTVSLQQIQGPRGFQYLKDDIEERVDLRSEGRVTNVIFRTFVIQ
ncbi:MULTISPECIES: flagellar basal body-associated FliL family protein [Rhizobium/Agrobacterium group]|jgi:flagellar FliL protein|uniref:flagellar basal body-associated FliL family protein n=1 Tax=Rhizobium/Agrobacterium group TaxID=227290 RepID=UPI0007138CCA|nr:MULTISPECIES: flagellar basal body-associated FliL family protein [Rhizobium/Agrobacterium group]KQY48884.1 flagellar basal body protein FliL [Rhizobium sp. Root483D2]